MEIFRLLLLCTFCFVPTVTFSVEGTNEHISYDIQDPEEPESIPSWKIIQEEDAEEGTVTKCSPPPTSPFGHYEGTTYEMGSTLSLKCDPGYKRTGSEVIRCVPMPYPFRLIVQWEPDNGTMPICRRNNQKDRLLFEEVTGDSDLKCSTPPSQTCGHYEGTNYDIGSKITLICDPGCELVGQSDLHCVGIPNPFRHMVMWDSFTGTMPSCRHIDQRIQRSLNQQEEKKNETPVARTIEIIEKDTTSPPYLESNGTPKSFKDEYGKTTETEHETGKHSVDCSSKAYTGPCRGSFPRFYYDIESDTCQNFTYGGCKGNSNNFKTKEACEKACVKSS